ncbi:ATP-grasp domain-containing protein [Lactobacillus delbrueckii]|uniref:ATP-grasp domain-containing protein n=1 Tax=Lactobacillus delbrueckii TaxID=1584 RepID=A0ABD4W4F8_9LACO|nr:ATP-grasp domain-containing protein [Lactobacillus delbrueckii]MCD5579555.1 ATP-grasp domain-containing protein [Lactobacillus delbrueckii subsp. lactis]MDA3778411.1 ATP-grasp domain-containing protein [Lactobacillus delbrueckii]MDA3783339.1 ATP-grasp domain-containing protein [Lactobacillus delbrueckii]MDA3795333.1 ATP-grasp domain-containing protein [Lactobacillus delbrueckii]MDA3842553.1 ATP-grasp domain-containing protein [Lactobacillus delbrueckii]
MPHSINIATAMYGFRELGAEIVPYHFIDEIEEKIGPEDIVLDYIEQCQWVFKEFGHPTYMDCYLEILKPFLKRKIWRDTINGFYSNEKKWLAGYFIKPVKDKAFTWKIIRNTADLIACGSSMEDYEILVSEPICISRGTVLKDILSTFGKRLNTKKKNTPRECWI